MNKKIEKVEYITLSRVKSEYKFSDKMITELLPEPVLRPNPNYRSAAPMKLFPLSAVESAVKTDKYVEMSKSRQNRIKGAKKAVETKLNHTKQHVDLMITKIHVIIISEDKLHDRTLSSKSEWYDYVNMCRGNYNYIDTDLSNVDTQTLRRWEVNYVRHELTEYDFDLYELSGKVGCSTEYIRYRNAVLDKIAEAYPYLRGECNRQKLR